MEKKQVIQVAIGDVGIHLVTMRTGNLLDTKPRSDDLLPHRGDRISHLSVVILTEQTNRQVPLIQTVGMDAIGHMERTDKRQNFCQGSQTSTLGGR